MVLSNVPVLKPHLAKQAMRMLGEFRTTFYSGFLLGLFALVHFLCSHFSIIQRFFQARRSLLFFSKMRPWVCSVKITDLYVTVIHRLRNFIH